jgi:hypothetical protein
MENPSKTYKRNIIAILIVVALMFFGVYCDFIPSKIWLEIGSIISAIVSLLITSIVWWRHWTGRHVINYKNIKSKPTRIFCTYLFLPLVAFMFIWVAMVHGLASGITIIIGKPKEETTALITKYTSSTRGCDYRLEGEYLNKAFPSYICINRERYEMLPKNVSVKLSGKETDFGFLVQSVYEQQL